MGNSQRKEAYHFGECTESNMMKHKDVLRMRSGVAQTTEESLTYLEEKYADLKQYQFPFENLVFEGGGCKGLAYSGAIKLLEDIGIWPQIRRLAGTSAGATTATLLSVGYTADDIEIFLGQNLDKLFQDHSCGYCSLLPNIAKKYGWNPGERPYKWLGEKLKEKCGDPDITFKGIHEMFGKELCVVVTNVNTLSAEYCHVKTTPSMPVRLACKMSMAIPVMFQAVKYKDKGTSDLYVDGGLLCNFPIHAFDGWYLSLAPEDSFLRRVHPIKELARLYDKSERFGEYNEKTLGFLLYSEDEPDILQYLLERRSNLRPDTFPKTKLSKKRIRRFEMKRMTEEEYEAKCQAAEHFLQILRKHDINEDSMINLEELEVAVHEAQSEERTARLLENMFGVNATAESIFKVLDQDEDEQITFNEVSTFFEEEGVEMQAQFIGYQRREINDLTEFAACIQEALLLNTKRIYVEKRDVERTVGINTYYIGTTDFNLEAGDQQLLVEQGRRSTISYLKEYIREKKPPLRVNYGLYGRELRLDNADQIFHHSNEACDNINNNKNNYSNNRIRVSEHRSSSMHKKARDPTMCLY